jgi:hypothetical protein
MFFSWKQHDFLLTLDELQKFDLLVSTWWTF